MKQIRQGDVLLVKVNSFPKDIKAKDNILAYGEVTGHKHILQGGQVQVFQDEEGMQYAEIKGTSRLIHEEHHELEIPKGKYKILLQREYDLIKGIKQVID